MRVFAVSMALCGSTAWRASAFVGSSLHTRMVAKPWFAPPTCRTRGRLSMQASEVEDDTPQVYYASEVTEGNQKTKFTEELGEQPLPENTQSDESDRFGPVNYDEYTDGDGFDGGDGQVGVVGDGSNAMETFDNSEVRSKKSKSWSAKDRVKTTTMVKESKSRQRNAWGSSTGYAEKLKDEGMMQVNLAGEDVKRVRRQQFENWRNQQEVTQQQRAQIAELDRLAGITDEEGAPSWKRGKDGYFDSFKKGAKKQEQEGQSWNTYSAPVTTGKKDGTQWEESTLTGNEKVEATVQCVSLSGRPGHNTVEVKNTVMTFEPFHCSFVGDKQGFEVSPVEGTLARRGGEPTTLDVSFLGRGPGDNRIGTLVVETEEDKWVFKIEGAMQ